MWITAPGRGRGRARPAPRTPPAARPGRVLVVEVEARTRHRDDLGLRTAAPAPRPRRTPRGDGRRRPIHAGVRPAVSMAARESATSHPTVTIRSTPSVRAVSTASGTVPTPTSRKCEPVSLSGGGSGRRSSARVHTGPMGLTAIDHVQLAMPAGGSPRRSRSTRACWASRSRSRRTSRCGAAAGSEDGPVRIHLGVEADFRPARKAHPAAGRGAGPPGRATGGGRVLGAGRGRARGVPPALRRRPLRQPHRAARAGWRVNPVSEMTSASWCWRQRVSSESMCWWQPSR